MISESVFSNKRLYLFFILSSAFFISAGIFFALGVYLNAGLSFAGGLIMTIKILSICNQTNASVSLLFESLRNNDTAIQFDTTVGGRQMKRLHESMNQAIKYFQNIRMQNEYNEQYYKALIQYSATGLVVMNQNNEIELINEVAARYGGIPPQTTNFRSLGIKNPVFLQALCDLKPGESKTFRNLISSEIQFLFFRASLIKKADKTVKMISIQDIRQELESKELESYRKLIHVLTHEIMNLITPVTTVSHSLYLLHKSDKKDWKKSEIENHTIKGLQVIEEQSDGIMNFVNNYRKISKIPEPVIAAFSVKEWVEQLEIAYSGLMKQKGIEFQSSVEKSIAHINADKKLLNQVMINLINNAVDALSEKNGERLLSLKISVNRHDKIVIRLINNGQVIPPEIQEKIFVPFFTTKIKGSGIGLSISQEIVKMHKGSIVMVSSPESLTCFTIELFK
jgi:two-component system, NtrC family, nitrogen regulation sensor histidine kinase NtrY